MPPFWEATDSTHTVILPRCSSSPYCFVGLTVNSKDGWDRWIYAAFTVATLAAILHFRHVPALAGWRF
ncbi:MAG: hypothetical protein WDN28_20625 [Chthoniobacter sp.]